MPGPICRWPVLKCRAGYVAAGGQLGILKGQKVVGQGPAPRFLPISIPPCPTPIHQCTQSTHPWLCWESDSLALIHTALRDSRGWDACLPLRELAFGPPEP